MKHLSSRERMLVVLDYEEPDHVPLLFNPFGFQPPSHLQWSTAQERVEAWSSLGVDDWLAVHAPSHTYHPDVKVRQWKETIPGERWPCMIAEYDTPAGVLRQEVFETDDWMTSDWPSHGSPEISLLDDYNVPRYRRPTIETEADLEKLAYLLYPVPDADITRFHEEAAEVGRQAEELGVLMIGYGPTGADTTQWLCGPEASILMAVDRPDLFDALMTVVQERDRRATEILMDTPVDLVMRRGYYEGTSFWSPDLYRRFFMPRIKEIVSMVHQADRKIAHAMSVGCMQLLNEFVETGYDAHHLLDPIPDGVRIDLHKVKAAFKDKIAVIGALNEPITLERGDPKEIRREVQDAIRILGPGGGLALTPAECICGSTPWESIEILIEAWKEARDYPLAH